MKSQLVEYHAKKNEKRLRESTLSITATDQKSENYPDEKQADAVGGAEVATIGNMEATKTASMMPVTPMNSFWTLKPKVL
jgi:hypothetical protein